MIDSFHLDEYGEQAVNYNRDIEIFPVLREILKQIMGESPYKSPTDMGVNMAGYCISDDEVVREASVQEIIRRYYTALCANKRGAENKDEIYKIELLMRQVDATIDDRPVVAAALKKAEETGNPAVAMQLEDGRIITGKTIDLLGSSSVLLLNVLKELAGIPDEIELISPTVIEPIQKLKIDHLGNHNPRLHTDEVLIALSICAVTNPTAELAMQQLSKLKGLEAHSTVILSKVDEQSFKRLGVNITYEPTYQTQSLYHK